MASSSASSSTRVADPTQFSFQQTMLRIKDPKPTLDYYTQHFGMTLIDKKSFPEYKFDLYFLASMPNGATVPEPGTKEANKHLWTFDRTTLELTHNYGTESDPAFSYANGNVEPHRGFGHIGFIVDDVQSFCDELEAKGVRFQKRPQDGRMKHIAFALDPDGYWVEILPRTSKPEALAAIPPQPASWPVIAGKPAFQQTMYRIKDPKASVPFYQKHFGMSLICERYFPEAKFSLYFMGTPPAGTLLPANPKSHEAWDWLSSGAGTYIELTHNHGSEADPDFKYHNGNTDPGRGFGHIGFLTPELEATCVKLEADGVVFTKRPHEGKMRGLAFAKDPDGYLIEIIQHGVDM